MRLSSTKQLFKGGKGDGQNHLKLEIQLKSIHLILIHGHCQSTITRVPVKDVRQPK
jgi:hypothetical protein